MSAFGPYGLDPFGLGVEGFPYALQNFQVRPGLEGPQAICTWQTPAKAILRLMIRRKIGEYPRQPDDGVLVLDTSVDPNTRTSCVDNGTDLLVSDAPPGGSRWWYYRGFVQPAPLPVAQQFGGRGEQVMVQSAPDEVLFSEPIDVQRFARMSIWVVNTGTTPTLINVETAPETTGPWIVVDALALDVGLSTTFELAHISFKYIRVRSSNADTTVRFVVEREPEWATGLAMSKACLVYKTGRHIDLLWNQDHLPALFRHADDEQGVTYLTEAEDAVGEQFLRGKDTEPHGALYRFLGMLGLELDRTHAYMLAVREFDTDLDEAPEDQLQHIAFELGWQVDLTRPLNDVREELFRLAGVWKARGTTFLYENVIVQHLSVIPRIQEGAGLVLRVANPDLFDREGS